MSNLPSTSRSLPMALIRARETVMTPIREMLAETGLTEQQWRVLRVLAEFGEMDSHSLASRASLLLPSLTRMAATLRGKGLITQERDPKDRRRQMLNITQSGQEIIKTYRHQASDIMEEFRNTLGAENYEALLDLLALLDPAQQRQVK
jgi:homoprotocatechuate degradation regulator HpaR